MDNELWRWVWVITAMVMGLGEMFTAGFFLLPFAIGATLAAVAAWLDVDGGIQWLLFFGGTAVSLLILRRFMGSQDQPDDLPVGANRYIGMSGRVIETIDNVDNTGRVRVESDEWRAVAAAGPIEEGSVVCVKALQGAKLLVEFVEPPPPGYVPHHPPPAAATSPESRPAAATGEMSAAEGEQITESKTPPENPRSE